MDFEDVMNNIRTAIALGFFCFCIMFGVVGGVAIPLYIISKLIK